MSNYINLFGAESVADAGHNISSAAAEMLRAANLFQESVNKLEVLLGSGYGSNLERLVDLLEKKEAK